MSYRVESFENSRWTVEKFDLFYYDAKEFVRKFHQKSDKLCIIVDNKTNEKLDMIQAPKKVKTMMKISDLKLVNALEAELFGYDMFLKSNEPAWIMYGNAELVGQRRINVSNILPLKEIAQRERELVVKKLYELGVEVPLFEVDHA